MMLTVTVNTGVLVFEVAGHLVSGARGVGDNVGWMESHAGAGDGEDDER